MRVFDIISRIGKFTANVNWNQVHCKWNLLFLSAWLMGWNFLAEHLITLLNILPSIAILFLHHCENLWFRVIRVLNLFFWGKRIAFLSLGNFVSLSRAYIFNSLEHLFFPMNHVSLSLCHFKFIKDLLWELNSFYS